MRSINVYFESTYRVVIRAENDSYLTVLVIKAKTDLSDTLFSNFNIVHGAGLKLFFLDGHQNAVSLQNIQLDTAIWAVKSQNNGTVHCINCSSCPVTLHMYSG